MEPNKDTTLERLMQGYCRFDHPKAQEETHAAARRLALISIQIENLIDGMSQGSTCLARDLKRLLFCLDEVQSDIQTRINENVMVIV
jgi:hypothetical protein